MVRLLVVRVVGDHIFDPDPDHPGLRITGRGEAMRPCTVTPGNLYNMGKMIARPYCRAL